MRTLKPSELVPALKIAFAAGRRPQVHGDPGIGKSQMMQQVADALFASAYGCKVVNGILYDAKGKVTENRPWFRDVRAALLDAVDLRGLPHIENGKSTWAIPDFLPTDPRGGIVFLDEVNRAAELTRNALFQWMDQGRIGDYVMPKAWCIAAAVNDKDIGAYKIGSALNARFAPHFYAVSDLEDVVKIAIERDWAPEVVAFLRFRPNLLHAYDPKAVVSPNPRAWEFASGICKQNPPKHLQEALYEGVLGTGVTVEFVSFCQMYKQLPDPAGIISNPDGAGVPSQPSVCWAISQALARIATVKTFTAIVRYLERLPVEYNVAAVLDAVRRVPALNTTTGYTQWCIKHQDVML